MNIKIYTDLARKSVECFVTHGKILNLPNSLPIELTSYKAGAFVTINKQNELRGCSGSIYANEENIAYEIIKNSISACSKDYRFFPIDKSELKELTYIIDILNNPQPVESTEELNTNKYAVLVSKGMKQGLVLPRLEGINIPQYQVSVALNKAGINPSDDYNLFKLKITHHICD